MVSRAAGAAGRHSHAGAWEREDDGFPVAILNRNEPAFYCVPAKAWEAPMERIDDLELNALTKTRLNDGQAILKVSLDDL